MQSVSELDERLSTPSAGLVEDVKRVDGDLLVLGAGGKLGPSLVHLAARALDAAGSSSRVIAVSRFGSDDARRRIEAAGAEAIAADVSDDAALAGLPEAPNVVYLVGAKFGTSGQEAATWTTNAYLPGRIARRYAASRISALSTGNVYPLVPVGQGATESTAPDPVGEYAMSCLGRERILENVSRQAGTRMSLIRLNYAVELRYGVLIDLARSIVAGDPVDLTTGFANVVWQGYANEVILRALAHASAPPFILNLTGPETVSVRQVAEALAERLGRDVRFTGEEAATALLSDASHCHGLFGYPAVSLAELVDATADWVSSGGETLDKPTKFQQRDGRF